jgi:hypothetical protein
VDFSTLQYPNPFAGGGGGMSFGGGGLGLGGGGGMSADIMNIYRALGAQGFTKPLVSQLPPELQQHIGGGQAGGVQSINGGGLQAQGQGNDSGAEPGMQVKPAIGRLDPNAVTTGRGAPQVSGGAPGGKDAGAAGGGILSMRMPMNSMPISIAQSPISSALLSSIGAGGGSSPAQSSPAATLQSFAPNVFHPDAQVQGPNVYHPTAPASPPIMAPKPLQMGNPPPAVDTYSTPGKDAGAASQAKPMVKPMPAAGGVMQVKPLKQPDQEIARQPEQVKPEIAAKLAKKLKPGSQATGGIAQTPDIINQSPILQKMALAMQRGPERY